MSEGCLVTPVSLVAKSRPTNPPKNTDPRPISKQPHASAWQGLNEVKDAASSCNAAVQPKHLDVNLSKEKGSQTFKQASPSASACKTCEAKCQVMYHILKYMDNVLHMVLAFAPTFMLQSGPCNRIKAVSSKSGCSAGTFR